MREKELPSNNSVTHSSSNHLNARSTETAISAPLPNSVDVEEKPSLAANLADAVTPNNSPTQPSFNHLKARSTETQFPAPLPPQSVEEEILSLVDALNGLTTNSNDPAGSATPTPCPIRKAKYYSVVVGRCCGVFSSWATVHPLVVGLPGAVYRGFRTFEGACWDYQTSKELGKVTVVRGSYDDFIFGPIAKACM